MVGYSCKDLNQQITFYPDNISSCCSGFTSPVFLEIVDNKIDFDKLLQNKKNLIEQFKNGHPLERCLPCYNLSEYDSSLKFDKFSKILVNHFTRCNCACIYCARDSYLSKEEKQSPQKYKLLPIIKEMYKRNLISTDSLDIEFQGGDIGCLSEFNDLVKIFSKKSKSNFHFFTNNIVYYDLIEKLFNQNRAELIVSLDCGTRETFKKIKQADKFDIVVKNLERYVKKSKHPNIVIKYIILKDINDNFSEIDSLITLMSSIGLTSLCIELDYNDCMELVPGKKPEYKVPQKYYELVDYFSNITQNKKISFGICNFTKTILDKGYF